MEQQRGEDWPKGLSAEAYLKWVEGRAGRFELVDGVPVMMAPERLLHAQVKRDAFLALHRAIADQEVVGCEAYVDGVSFQVSDDTVFEPDASVYWGERLPGDQVLVPDLIVVVEVISPSSHAVDTGKKYTGYMGVPGPRHYLVIDPRKRLVVHHRKDEAGEVRSSILSSGAFDLDPPGITIRVEDLFADLDPPVHGDG